jgi:membrane-bound lytic murein transglycosylase A
MIRLWGVALLMALFGQADKAMADVSYSLVSFEQLTGWEEDDHQKALDVFLNTCRDINDPEWRTLCDFAQTSPNAREFFELFFQPVLMEDGDDMLFTGYFEPELRGARRRGGIYQYPLYRLPDDFVSGRPYLTRQEIEQSDALEGKGLEIAWLANPVDAFFLQVQGSGRVRLPDGGTIRVGYAGKNGHEYSSVGQELVRRGVYEPHQVSADVIRSYVAKNPDTGRRLLWVNKSYVFFREVSEVPADAGPLGAMNRSITTLRSIAVDPSIVRLGAPVWIDKHGANPVKRLMIAQDTGSAIKGAQRADIFYGTGEDAGRTAGRIKDGGRMVVLLPIQMAYAKVPQTQESTE